MHFAPFLFSVGRTNKLQALLGMLKEASAHTLPLVYLVSSLDRSSQPYRLKQEV